MIWIVYGIVMSPKLVVRKTQIEHKESLHYSGLWTTLEMKMVEIVTK